MSEQILHFDTKNVRIISSQGVIRKNSKYPVPRLVINCSPLLIYAAIIDYKNCKHYSVAVQYNEFVDSDEYQTDVRGTGKALAKLAKHNNIKQIYLTNNKLTDDEKFLLKSLKESY